MAQDPPSDSPGRAGGRGVRRGLPTAGLVEAEAAAKKLWDAARRGMAPGATFAKQLGLGKASGGSWRERVAHLNGFGLIKQENDQFGLTQLGLDLVQDHDLALKQQARRSSVLTLKSYRELINDYDGTELPSTPLIASKLEHEFGKSPDVALQAATAFVASLAHASLIDANGVVSASGFSDGTSGPAESEQGGTVDSNGSIVQLPPRDAAAEAEIEDEIDHAFEDAGPLNDALEAAEAGVRPRPTIILEVKLDLSAYTADEVVKILGALGIARDE